jgi:hypothetical protein
MSRINNLERDQAGNIILRAATRFFTGTVGNGAVFLAIEYVESEEMVTSGTRNQMQFVLTPQSCLALASKLTELAQRTLEPPVQTPDARVFSE